MKSIRLVLLLVVVIISSCSSDEETPTVEQPFVTLNLKETWPGVDHLWAFITDSHGKVISSKKLSIGHNKFTGTAPDVINVTLLDVQVDVQNIQNHYRFTT